MATKKPTKSKPKTTRKKKKIKVENVSTSFDTQATEHDYEEQGILNPDDEDSESPDNELDTDYDEQALTTSSGKEKEPMQSKLGYWLKWIPAAKRAADRHWNQSRAAWREYQNDWMTPDSVQYPLLNNPGYMGQGRSFYPIFWASCKTIEPAFYARTPEESISRRWGVNDWVSVTASVIAERLANYLLENGNIDEAMTAAVQDFILADKATVQVIYETKLVSKQNRIALKKLDDSDRYYTSA